MTCESHPSIRAALALGLWLLLPACGPSSTASEPTPHIWTLRQMREASAASGTIAGVSATEWVTPRGQPIAQWSPPYASAALVQSTEQDGLNVLPAFSEGRPAAFSVPEVWERVPEVWVQPWYVLVTEYVPSNPGSKRLKDSLALVDIEEESLFYSPFWEIIYVVVPQDTPPDRYTSAAALFAAGLPMHRGGGLLAPLTPEDVLPAIAEGHTGPVRPLTGESVGNAGKGEVWLHGRRVPYLSFGSNTFTWSTEANRVGIIDEVALYVFARAGEDGRPRPLGLPAILGTGPRGAGRAPRISSTGVPQFGTLTRPHFALLPNTAGPFIPGTLDLLKEALRGEGALAVVDVHPDIEARADAKDYVLRVALNPECFKDPAKFPGTCRWLDSQAAVETNLAPSSLQAQDVLFTSPVLFYDGKKVGR
ncbi:hypothetical protein [Hyalangium rubrum]|uniref:Lipoprotein n=1 Tax=Hyalangium rubrum TaxID=3103134 RepID=A0ABU5HDF9_9BACT|nr:hypothetical protein [Hyalangium sp. s54d21]MDY7231497.1 hypothetical protein [Hyalangium sp. s54d21]